MVDTSAANHGYEITPRPSDLGGGWKLRLLEGDTELGGGVSRPMPTQIHRPAWTGGTVSPRPSAHIGWPRRIVRGRATHGMRIFDSARTTTLLTRPCHGSIRELRRVEVSMNMCRHAKRGRLWGREGAAQATGRGKVPAPPKVDARPSRYSEANAIDISGIARRASPLLWLDGLRSSG
jgi:hypothetical protein